MPNPLRTVGTEISHLIRDKGFPQRRAVAASLNMQRDNKLRQATRPARRGPRR